MKASELRIGNLVDLGNRIAKVIEINHLSCVVVDLEETQDTIEDYKRIKPIPLTEKWLLNFGFKLAGDFTNTRVLDVVKHAYDCSEIRYSPNEGLLRFSNGGIKGSTIIPYVKHVHQLQNLYFALTGEELTLKS